MIGACVLLGQIFLHIYPDVPGLLIIMKRMTVNHIIYPLFCVENLAIFLHLVCLSDDSSFIQWLSVDVVNDGVFFYVQPLDSPNVQTLAYDLWYLLILPSLLVLVHLFYPDFVYFAAGEFTFSRPLKPVISSNHEFCALHHAKFHLFRH